jgi:hypothetical protein
MYIWKCWRETRLFTTVFLIIAAALMPVIAAFSAGTHFMEEFGRTAFSSAQASILMGMGLWLGVIAALHGFDEKTVHILFTKPRRRASFLWMGWAVGCAELLAVGLVNLFSGWLTLSRYTSQLSISEIVGSNDYATFCVMSVFTYSLTYAFTAVLRNGVNGLGASLGCGIAYDVFALTARLRWNIHLPFPLEQVGSLPPGISNLVWMSIGMCFVLAGQLVVERAEV